MVALLAAALLGLPAQAVGQTVAPPSVDERVRVETESGVELEGVVTGISSSRLEIQPGEGPLVAVEMDEVTRLRVARGKRFTLSRGATHGFLVGAGAGVVLGAIAGSTSTDDYICGGGCGKELAVIGGLGLGVVGLLAGTIVATKAALWVDVPLGPVSLDVDPSGGTGIGLSFTLFVGS